RDVVFALGKLAQRNFFADAHLVNQAEIGRTKHAQVLAVLLVNTLDVFGNHQFDAGREFGIRRLLAAGAFAATLSADRSHKATLLYIAALDRHFIAALQARVRPLT